MRISVISILLTALGLSGPARAEFTEVDVTVAEGVAGKIATPVSDESAPERVVLLLHGWDGSMDEVGDMYKRLAGELGNAGIASLRIDFRGEGERNGHRLTSTFATRIADAEAALAMVQEKFPEAKIGVVGFSLGGATALALTGKHPEAITSLVLWSSASNLADGLGNTERAAAQREAIEKGETTIQAWVKMTLTREHIIGFIGYDLMGPLKAYEGALLSIRGSDDHLKRYEDQFLETASGWREEFMILGGADHIFHTLDPESKYDERVIAATLLWFTETL